MSKGTEAIALLQAHFGERVDPTKALALLFAKLGSQNEIMGRLKNLCCGLAFDHGTLAGVYASAATSETADEALALLLAMPRCELRAETVEPNQPPSVRLT